jgi:RNA polymerase sigma factor (sigma-70 family)
MSSTDSVTVWIERIKQGDSAAADALWKRFFPQLVRVARHKLRSAQGGTNDEEDIALSVMKSFFLAAQRQRFPDLSDRDSLWRLLSEMTRRKAVDQIRHGLSKKRGEGRTQGDSRDEGDSCREEGRAGLSQIADDNPTPELAALFADECQRLLSQLPPPLQQLTLAKLEGYTNEEIAQQSSCSLRSVERQLRLIREMWSQEIPRA